MRQSSYCADISQAVFLIGAKSFARKKMHPKNDEIIVVRRGRAVSEREPFFRALKLPGTRNLTAASTPLVKNSEQRLYAPKPCARVARKDTQRLLLRHYPKIRV